MKRVNNEEEEQDSNVNPAPTNLNELMALSQPFSSDQYIRDIVSAVKLGEVQPFKAFVLLKRFEKVAKKCLDDKEFKKICTEDAYKYLQGNQTVFEAYSAKICKGATYTTYDFSETGDYYLEELYKIQEQLEALIKNREEELKLIGANKPEGFGISADTKQIVVTEMPKLIFEPHDDQITVRAPKKMQTIGIKFMKV